MLTGAPYDVTGTVQNDQRERNAEFNKRNRALRTFDVGRVLEGDVVIVGGGPSLADLLDEVRARQSNGAKIWATNNTYAFLIGHGIQPDAHVLLDARPENAAFIMPHPSVTYYLNVCCDPAMFEKVDSKGCAVVMYDLSQAATGNSVGIKAIYLAAFEGYRSFYLYGFDSCYREVAPECDAECAAKHIPGYDVLHVGSWKHHAYTQTLNDNEKVVDVIVEGRGFRAAPWMVIQAEEFQQVAVSLAQQGCEIRVRGDGLIPWIARRLTHVPKVLTAVWDLQIAPPQYDFVVFLNEAERARLAMDAEFIDLIIQPGPVNGFRDDDLPDNLGSRVGMLYRVTIGMARLLPSVRNIEVLKQRRVIEAENLFPVGYSAANPVTQYGQHYAQFARQILRASEVAKAYVERKKYGKYVTITLREATHWPIRNSNKRAWLQASVWLEERGYRVVWVHDAESEMANLYSFDFDMRLALYEGAIVNLGINNGPTLTMPFTSARHIIFKMVTPEVPWTTREFHEKWGTKEGDQPNGTGRFVFEPDDYEVIVRELKLFFSRVAQREAA